MNLSLDTDGSKRLPAINAGVLKSLVSGKKALASLSRVKPLKAGLTLQQKKYAIGVLTVFNLGVIGATVAQDHSSRVQDVKAIEDFVAPTPEKNRIAVKPVKSLPQSYLR